MICYLLIWFLFCDIVTLISVDGAWVSWSAWDTCTTTCGTGSQNRSRTCTNPAPQYSGADCSGSGIETQDCNTNPCPSEMIIDLYKH